MSDAQDTNVHQLQDEGIETPKARKSTKRKAKNTEAVNMTADELRGAMQSQAGTMATSVSKPLIDIVAKTASQQVMLGTVMRMPQILEEAGAGLDDFLSGLDPDEMAFSLTVNMLPETTKELLLTAGE